MAFVVLRWHGPRRRTCRPVRRCPVVCPTSACRSSRHTDWAVARCVGHVRFRRCPHPNFVGRCCGTFVETLPVVTSDQAPPFSCPKRPRTWHALKIALPAGAAQHQLLPVNASSRRQELGPRALAPEYRLNRTSNHSAGWTMSTVQPTAQDFRATGIMADNGNMRHRWLCPCARHPC